MKIIRRDGKIITGSNRNINDDIRKQWIEIAKSKERMYKACKIGISEFIDEDSEMLNGIPILSRIIFLNRVRNTILESLYSSFKTSHEGNEDLFFDFEIFTEKEKQFVIFGIDELNTCETWKDTKQFIHDNFKNIRSVEDAEALLGEKGDD